MSGGSTESAARRLLEGSPMMGNGRHREKETRREDEFQMPVHYPRYGKTDYETMPEWKLDRLLAQYGLPLIGDVDKKRSFAIGAFLWPPL